MKRIVGLFLILVTAFSFFSCEDEDDSDNGPYLIVKFQFDQKLGSHTCRLAPATNSQMYRARCPACLPLL